MQQQVWGNIEHISVVSMVIPRYDFKAHKPSKVGRWRLSEEHMNAAEHLCVAYTVNGTVWGFTAT